MLNYNEILATQDMIDKRHLDIRTITMGISLLDCCDPDLSVCCAKIYKKITTFAKDLVKTGEEIEKEFGIPIVNKRISVTPISLVAAACQTDSSEETFGESIWTLEMYVDTPPEDEWDYDHILNLSAGFQENLVRISGGDALPDGIFYVEDDQLYWMVRSINDYETSIEESALSAYQDTIEAYIAEEQGKCGNPAVKVELLSIEERMNRSDIGVAAYSIGTVLTADSPQELMQYMAGGAYFDSLLRLHPDGNSVRSTMLVINGTPVGFLNWEALDAIESQDISSSEDVMDILSQGKDWFKAI